MLGKIFIFSRHVAIKKTNYIDNLCQSHFLAGAVTPGSLYILPNKIGHVTPYVQKRKRGRNFQGMSHREFIRKSIIPLQ